MYINIPLLVHSMSVPQSCLFAIPILHFKFLINPRCACAARVTVLGHVCVCLSVKSHLTSGASVCPENTVAYSAGNGGQNICGVFFKTGPFKSYGVKCKRKSQYAN